MICFCSQNAREGIHACLHDYDRLINVAVILIYIQIGCSLIGSLGALYNGASLMNLGIALFALVAIASSSQSLGRTYAILLFCAILLDIFWFILFSRDIWNTSNQSNEMVLVFSLRLTLAMEILGSCVRFFSSLLWIQIYRLGASDVDSCANLREPDFGVRNSFLNSRQRSNSDSDDAVGSHYSSLLEDRQLPESS
ncbi:Ras GTPase-activating-like protein rng2 isoform 2 [Hibiscus syriacus]|uniref:Ras GTPase-activating-like protein rng2 isoform 2 n=1 Tax=Hibiscus syriacus TaxID=106335 RepID=A0A6A3D8B3_HIBSY|nr:uncharacterized protein LOC120202664 [Hibiscus syriacus]XP_039059013.1 uncharacterized protein LOC120202664 [Hibiscus syriacus]KAE8735482.1 Ras GTPase-activating-like protein rng2 isoform 2 [Hibiscus syriacus]